MNTGGASAHAPRSLAARGTTYHPGEGAGQGTRKSSSFLSLSPMVAFWRLANTEEKHKQQSPKAHNQCFSSLFPPDLHFSSWFIFFFVFRWLRALWRRLSLVGADSGCWGRVDLPFSPLPPAVASNGHLQNKPKIQTQKQSVLLFFKSQVCSSSSRLVGCAVVEGLGCRQWLVVTTWRWVCKGGPLGERKWVCGREWRRMKRSLGLRLEKARKRLVGR